MSEEGEIPVFEMRLPLPPRVLSPNDSSNRQSHGRAKIQAIAIYKHMVWTLALNEVRRLRWRAPGFARIFYRFGLGGITPGSGLYQPEDWDNAVASIKALQDGLVKAGVVVDDDWGHLACGGVSHTRLEGPWVEVRVQAVGEPAPSVPEVRQRRKGRKR